MRVINRITRNSYEGCFSRHVSGTDIPPDEKIFGYAGYQVERTTRKLPNLGANLNDRGRVTGLPPDSEAGTTPLQSGDLILSIDGQTLEGQGSRAVFRLLNAKSVQTVRLRIRGVTTNGNWEPFPSTRSWRSSAAVTTRSAPSGRCSVIRKRSRQPQSEARRSTFQFYTSPDGTTFWSTMRWPFTRRCTAAAVQADRS